MTDSQYFTNTSKGVFCLVNLPEVVKGALFSRYSRSPKSLRAILTEEFLNNPNFSGIDTKKAEDFYDRVLLGYGDDSVAELGGAHLAIEGISNIATKFVEDSRIGVSFLEKSTRYVRFDEKVNGNYQFFREPDIMSSRHADTYVQTCNMLFDAYSGLMNPITKFIEENNPRGEESDRAYKSAVRAKACDILRGLLPASVTTNLGMYGNGRAFEYLITKMASNDLAEVRNLGEEMRIELSKVIPSFVKRADSEHGREMRRYLSDTRKSMEAFSVMGKASAKQIELIDNGNEDKAMAAMLYPFSNVPFSSILAEVRKMPHGRKEKIACEYIGRRANRRHKPGRALENVHYTFDILANYAAFRDIHRHRMLTQERQLLSTNHGYDMPKELLDSGFGGKFTECMVASRDAFGMMEGMEKQAQYLVPMAYRIRWYMTLSLREIYFLTELRSSQQGHPDYRKIAQSIHEIAKEKSPLLGAYMKFVDMNDYSLERLEAEKKTDRKIQERNSSSVR